MVYFCKIDGELFDIINNLILCTRAKIRECVLPPFYCPDFWEDAISGLGIERARVELNAELLEFSGDDLIYFLSSYLAKLETAAPEN